MEKPIHVLGKRVFLERKEGRAVSSELGREIVLASAETVRLFPNYDPVIDNVEGWLREVHYQQVTHGQAGIDPAREAIVQMLFREGEFSGGGEAA